MSDHRFLPALRLTLAVAALSLVASTWPLWTGSSSFPHVPFLECLCGVGPGADSVCLTLILGGAFSTLVGSAVSLIDGGRKRQERVQRIALRMETIGPWLLAIGLGLAALLNQHRLQPWVWHFILLAPLLAPRLYIWDVDWRGPPVLGTPDLNRPETMDYIWIAALTGAVYFGSAVSKCDAGFSETYGQQLVEALLSSIGLSTRLWSDAAREATAASLPLCELATVFLFMHPRCRRIGLPLSIVMHSLLILAVGPLGLNHEPGVLIWNGYFIAQNAILWKYSNSTWIKRLSEIKPPTFDHISRKQVAAVDDRLTPGAAWKLPLWCISLVLPVPVICLAFFLPAIRVFGLCDPWPAWAVYASQPERVTILVEREAAEKLPEDLRRFLRPRQLDDGRVFFRADLWSIEATGAPIYPGDRFPVAVAKALSERRELHDKVDLVVEGPAAWWSGEREVREYRGTEPIAKLATGFWINTQARR